MKIPHLKFSNVKVQIVKSGNVATVTTLMNINGSNSRTYNNGKLLSQRLRQKSIDFPPFPSQLRIEIITV